MTTPATSSSRSPIPLTCTLLAALTGLGTACADVEPAPEAPIERDRPPAEGELGRVRALVDGEWTTLTYRVQQGRAIFQGDIDLGDADALHARWRGGAVLDDVGKRWSDGIVPFEFAATVDVNTRAVCHDAMSAIEAVTAIDFVPRNGHADYIRFDEENLGFGGANSSIGRQGGMQDINISEDANGDGIDDTVSERTMIHELLHALGLWHEQSRPDRDLYVTIDWDCSIDDPQYQLEGSSLALGLYDFNSVMHYRTTSFCAYDDANGNGVHDGGEGCTCDTMSRANMIPGLNQTWSANTLSAEDVNTLHRMYPPVSPQNEAAEHAGTAVVVADFDGDGYADVAVGAPHADVGGVDRGHVMIYRGTSLRLVPWQLLTQADTGNPPENGDQFGASLATGDLDGDGLPDLVVGVPGEKTAIANGGIVQVFRGGRDGLTPWRDLVEPTTSGARFGAAVATGRLRPALGRDLVVVGAPGMWSLIDPMGGAAYVFDATVVGSSSYPPLTQAGLGPIDPSANFGAAIAVGDLDGDGDADVAVGAPEPTSGSGAVYVFRAAPWGALQPYDELRGPNARPSQRDRFGAALAIGRGLRNTPYLAVGAPGRSAGRGAAHLAGMVGDLGMMITSTITQSGADDQPGDELGAALAFGNVIGPSNSQQELLVGVPGEDGGSGRVLVHQGAFAAQALRQHDVPFQASAAGDRFGSAIAVGNLDLIGDDGSTDELRPLDNRFLDVVVGAPMGERDTSAGTAPLDSGTITVYLGVGGAQVLASEVYDRASGFAE